MQDRVPHHTGLSFQQMEVGKEGSGCQSGLFLTTLAHLHGLSSQIASNVSSDILSWSICITHSQKAKFSELSGALSYTPHTCHGSGSASFLPGHPAVSLLFREDSGLRMVRWSFIAAIWVTVSSLSGDFSSGFPAGLAWHIFFCRASLC